MQIVGKLYWCALWWMWSYCNIKEHKRKILHSKFRCIVVTTTCLVQKAENTRWRGSELVPRIAWCTSRLMRFQMKIINTKIIGTTIAMICNVHTIRNNIFCYLWDPQPSDGLGIDKDVHELIFQILSNCAALFILCPCSCQHYIFYTFFLSINRLQESWFFHSANSTQNYTQCNLGKKKFYTTTLHVVTVTSSSCWRHSKEKVICKIPGYK